MTLRPVASPPGLSLVLVGNGRPSAGDFTFITGVNTFPHSCSNSPLSRVCSHTLWSSCQPLNGAGVCTNHRIPGLENSPMPILPPSQLWADKNCTRTTTMRNLVLLNLPSLSLHGRSCSAPLTAFLVLSVSLLTWTGALGHDWIPKAAGPKDVPWRKCLPGAPNNSRPCTGKGPLQFTKDLHSHRAHTHTQS